MALTTGFCEAIWCVGAATFYAQLSRPRYVPLARRLKRRKKTASALISQRMAEKGLADITSSGTPRSVEIVDGRVVVVAPQGVVALPLLEAVRVEAVGVKAFSQSHPC
jgi:hypothetical protein